MSTEWFSCLIDLLVFVWGAIEIITLANVAF